MRRGLFIGVILFTTLAVSSPMAEQPPSDVTCALWSSASEGEKLMYAVGYSVGATSAAATAGLRLEKDGLARELLMYLLPENHRFGAIVSKVDSSCDLAATRDKSIMTVLKDIARVKNAELVYKHENREYQQFFEKMSR